MKNVLLYLILFLFAPSLKCQDFNISKKGTIEISESYEFMSNIGSNDSHTFAFGKEKRKIFGNDYHYSIIKSSIDNPTIEIIPVDLEDISGYSYVLHTALIDNIIHIIFNSYDNGKMMVLQYKFDSKGTIIGKPSILFSTPVSASLKSKGGNELIFLRSNDQKRNALLFLFKNDSKISELKFEMILLSENFEIEKKLNFSIPNEHTKSRKQKGIYLNEAYLNNNILFISCLSKEGKKNRFVNNLYSLNLEDKQIKEYDFNFIDNNYVSGITFHAEKNSDKTPILLTTKSTENENFTGMLLLRLNGKTDHKLENLKTYLSKEQEKSYANIQNRGAYKFLDAEIYSRSDGGVFALVEVEQYFIDHGSQDQIKYMINKEIFICSFSKENTFEWGEYISKSQNSKLLSAYSQLELENISFSAYVHEDDLYVFFVGSKNEQNAVKLDNPKDFSVQDAGFFCVKVSKNSEMQKSLLFDKRQGISPLVNPKSTTLIEQEGFSIGVLSKEHKTLQFTAIGI